MMMNRIELDELIARMAVSEIVELIKRLLDEMEIRAMQGSNE